MPEVETNARRILDRLQAEGWLAEGGSKHAKLAHPNRPGIIIISRVLRAGFDTTIPVALDPPATQPLGSQGMAQYLALIEETDTAFGLVIPDCPGCCAMGHSFDEVFENGVEALREWMTDRVAAGFPPPEPRDAFALRRDPTLAEDFDTGSIIAMLPLLLDAGSEVSADVSLDAGLLLQIDAAARLRGVSRSAFLAAAAREKIAVGR